jgi:hypothetical protein
VSRFLNLLLPNRFAIPTDFEPPCLNRFIANFNSEFWIGSIGETHMPSEDNGIRRTNSNASDVLFRMRFGE